MDANVHTFTRAHTRTYARSCTTGARVGNDVLELCREMRVMVLNHARLSDIDAMSQCKVWTSADHATMPRLELCVEACPGRRKPIALPCGWRDLGVNSHGTTFGRGVLHYEDRQAQRCLTFRPVYFARTRHMHPRHRVHEFSTHMFYAFMYARRSICTRCTWTTPLLRTSACCATAAPSASWTSSAQTLPTSAPSPTARGWRA